MTTAELAALLTSLLEVVRDDEDLADECHVDADELLDVCSFERAGVMTHNEGLVVSLEDGSEFQVTVVRSRR
jgi:hypothetical protein